MARTGLLLRLGLLALSAEAGAALAATESVPAKLDKDEGWHVVRPGDTLEGLSIRYLGSAAGWRELYRLNPRILDPHWIYPGRRVRVPLRADATQSTAQIAALSRRVEEQPAPVSWLEAGPNDLLLEHDGLRTFESSSALLRFEDGTTATISEESLVFIRRQTPPRDAAPHREIEIELGQAEVAARPVRGGQRTPEIEVVVGGARATSRPTEAGALRSRHRAADGGAEVMVYEGSGRLATATGAVDLPAGTGTSASAGAAPRPAERLLPAPEQVSPFDGAELVPGQAVPELRWKGVPGAASFVVELCHDRACDRLLERRKVGNVTAHRGGVATRAAVYWRVTAVSASGLDGFPSRTRVLRPALLVNFE